MISRNPSAPSEFVAFGPVQLDVVDLERSTAWWRDLVGLPELDARGDSVELGVGEPLVILRERARTPVHGGYSGLYHLAINLPNEVELARVLARLLASGHPIGTTDHLVAKSIYLNDPDGIGLELALETPERVSVFRWQDAQPVIVDVEGRRHGGAEPLDVDQVLASLTDGDILRPLPPAARVGHLHLKVSDLGRAYRFYRDALGLLESNFVPAIGYGDLGAGGALSHRIAVNVWQGIGVPPRPADMAGMARFTLRFTSRERLEDALDRLGVIEDAGGYTAVRDPDGNTLELTASTAVVSVN